MDLKPVPLSVAFVGVYNTIPQMIPGLDNKFCRHLFDNPDETVNGMSAGGYTISINNDPIPLIVINSQKIIFKSRDIDSLISYECKVKNELKRIGFNPRYSAFGINYEYEILGLDYNSDLWISNSFIKADIFGGKEKRCNVLSLRFDINESEIVNISFEPRQGVRNGVFVSINHHHASTLKELPDEGCLRGLYEKSLEKISKDFLSFWED